MLRTQSSPTQIAFYEPLSWWVPIGFVVFLAFSGGIACFWGFGFLANMNFRIDSPWMLIPVGIILLILVTQVLQFFGALIKWFGRMGAEIDLKAGTVDTSWGILLPLPWSQRPLAAFDRLFMGREITEYQTRSGTRIEIEHQLFLMGPSGDPLLVGRHEYYGPVRVMAEELGQFLKMDVIDATESSAVVIPCDTLCQPAWVRGRNDLAKYEGPPTSGTIRYRVEGKTLHVECPADGDTGCLVWALLPIGLLIWFLVYIFNVSNGEGWVAMLIIGGIGFSLIALFSSAFLPTTQSAIVSPDQLVLLDSGVFGTSRTELPAEAVWEVTSNPGGVTFLTTDGVHFLSTTLLPAGETERLRVCLLHFLAAGKA